MNVWLLKHPFDKNKVAVFWNEPKYLEQFKHWGILSDYSEHVYTSYEDELPLEIVPKNIKLSEIPTKAILKIYKYK